SRSLSLEGEFLVAQLHADEREEPLQLISIEVLGVEVAALEVDWARASVWHANESDRRQSVLHGPFRRALPVGPRRADNSPDKPIQSRLAHDHEALLRHGCRCGAPQATAALGDSTDQDVLSRVTERVGEEVLTLKQAILLDVDIEIGVAAECIHSAVDDGAGEAAVLGANPTGAQVVRVAVVAVQLDPSKDRIRAIIWLYR